MKKQTQTITNSDLQQIRANKLSIYEYNMYFKSIPNRQPEPPEFQNHPAHVHNQIGSLDSELEDLHLYLSTQQQFILDELAVHSFYPCRTSEPSSAKSWTPSRAENYCWSGTSERRRRSSGRQARAAASRRRRRKRSNGAWTCSTNSWRASGDSLSLCWPRGSPGCSTGMSS